MAMHKQNDEPKGISPFTHIFFLVCFFSCFFIEPVSSDQQGWDGVVVTAADFQALQAFKQELIDSKGFLKSWNGWVGIKCAKGQFIVIQLPWKGLGGRITEKIGQLQALRKLSLHDDVIQGSIPRALGVLPDLRGVQLFKNRLSGSIPATLGSCPSLQTLDLSNNSLTGVVPESLANSTKLYRLNLSFNLISGSVPVSFARSSSLIFLDLQPNNLSGPIPDSWGPQNHSRLRNLDLSYNAINGSLPVSLFNLSSLVVLNLESNGLEDQIPESIQGLHNLSVLVLKRNKLSGPIPASVGNISSLTKLDLSGNKLSGEIPFSLANLKTFNSFNVSYNNLSGLVPAPLSQKFNSSSFVGNIELCGYSGSPPCPSPPPLQNLPSSPSRNRDINIENLSSAGEKGIPTPAGEIEPGGETGGKLVHFDGPMVFTADDLLCATAEIMGKSTYGTVYNATLEDGNQVAVKRLREKITKGQKEFETEVNLLGKIRHRNLLAMRAYYLGPKGEKLLVFDYMPKGSLATFLHARGPETTVDWPTRMRIAKGVTRGLMYLHTQENIIHGNLTSSNVLLDEKINAKIADFGLSRLMTAAANANVIATAGALEAMNGVDLPQWVASIVKEEWTNEVFDLELMRDASSIGDELLNTLKLGLHCVDPSPSARPEVQQVLQQLEEIRPDTPASSAPSGDDGAGVPSTSE
ncbi:leucine-rich repeat receptor-like protein kinase IMK2 [Hibiscus syriacus]|uniref:non-specific serine/threonine protein kinase n=1 Tax=Hibiscus syriacus TaxID=106335 RepID=A0A6A2ZE35_HIBSY|nr:leucine-rich repeat receptor-like protein kinase IMK2 [Hibiscus syriacus]